MGAVRQAEDVTFLLPNQVGLYTCLPVVQELLFRGVKIHIVCRQQSMDSVRQAVSIPADRVLPIEPIARRYSAVGRLHRSLLFAFTSRDFSAHYRELHDLSRESGSMRKALWHLGKLIPSWPPDSINRRVRACISPILKNPFPSRRIVALTQTSFSHLLCGQDQSIVTLMESWDHPYKAPAGFCSQVVLAWNGALAADWARFQGSGNVSVGYPLKLRYALSRPTSQTDRPNIGAPRQALYAASTSALTAYPGWFEDECRLIGELCRATQIAGWKLVIKPKPAGSAGEFDKFPKEFGHVSIGAYREAPPSVDYYLDDDYNRIRLGELDSCDLVINSGTTFALDAAAAGRPVLQLDLRGSTEFPVVATASGRHHISSYLMGDATLVWRPGSGGFAASLGAYLSAPDQRSVRLSEHLRQWLTTKDLTNAVCAIADAVLDPQEADADRQRL